MVGLFGNIELPADIAQVQGRGRRRHRPLSHRVSLHGPRVAAGRGRTVRGLPQGHQGNGGKPVTIRTLDIGADKALEGINTRVELNPALGLRAIRFRSPNRRSSGPAAALLRASHYGKLKLLVPMLTHAHEIDQTPR